MLVISIALAKGGIELGHLRAILVNWDARHYLYIATHGYPASGPNAHVIAFFPLYPWLIRGLSYILQSEIFSGVVITVTASIGAHALFIRYAVEATQSRVRGYRAAALFFLSPISVACTLIYTEALFLLAIAGLLHFTQSRRKDLVGGVTAVVVASMTRLVGVLSYLPLIGALLMERPIRPIRIFLSTIATMLAASLYPLVNYFTHGNPFHFLDVQREHWHKSAKNPITEWWLHLEEISRGVFPPDPWMAFDYFVTIVVPVVLVLSLARSLVKRSSVLGAWWVWVAANWAIVASQSFWLSNSRYLLACLPLYLIIEELLPRRGLLFGFVLGLLLVVTISAFLQAGTGGWLF